MSEEKSPGFKTFSESLDLARRIEDRVVRNGLVEPYRAGGFDRLKAFQNILAIERFITGLYADIRYNAAASSPGLCTGIASEAFLVSLACAPRYYRGNDSLDDSGIDSDVMIFMKKMADAIALNEIDLDLGSGRWTVATDLLMGMLDALNIVSTAILIEVQENDPANIALRVDMENNVITGCSLVAAYSLVLFQCLENGSYRGQVLSDLQK